jgi:DNA-binding transcriptional ArsR family regulator
MGGKPRRRVEQKRLSKDKTVDFELRLARALNHPLRAEILSHINQEPMAAVELCERLDLPLSNISYHVRVLYELKCIEPIKEERIRGATKTTYRGCTRMLLDDVGWATLSPEAKSELTVFSVGALIDRAQEAIAADTFDGRSDRLISTTTLALDQEGWLEVTKILANALDRVIATESEAADRVKGVDDRFRATIGIMSFESPKHGTPPKQ